MKLPKAVLALQRHPLFSLFFRGTKFLVVAWVGMGVNTLCLYLFKGVWGMRLIPASMLAIEIAIVHNFFWLRHWAWRDRGAEGGRPPFFKQLLNYNLATGAVDLVANITILWLLAAVVGVHYLLANIAGQILGPVIKFWVNEKLIFKETR